MSWYESARERIRALDATLPADMPFDERQKAVSAAYPWGERRMHPYKMWLKAQREYLTRYCPPEVDSKRFPLSPLERAIAKSKRAEASPMLWTPWGKVRA